MLIATAVMITCLTNFFGTAFHVGGNVPHKGQIATPTSVYITATEDTWVDVFHPLMIINNPPAPHDRDTILRVRLSDEEPRRTISLLKFSIPITLRTMDVQIEKAVFELYTVKAFDVPGLGTQSGAAVSEIGEDWDSKTVTPTNIPVIIDRAIDGLDPAEHMNDWSPFEVTEVVSEWSRGAPAHGFAIEGARGSWPMADFVFSSVESEFPPRILISFRRSGSRIFMPLVGTKF